MGNSLYKLDVFLGFGGSSVNGRVFHCRVWLQGIPSSDFPRTPWASFFLLHRTPGSIFQPYVPEGNHGDLKFTCWDISPINMVVPSGKLT